jgi:hypothetical protein
MDEANRSSANITIPDADEHQKHKRGRAVTFSMDLAKAESEQTCTKLPKDRERNRLQQFMGRIKSVIF